MIKRLLSLINKDTESNPVIKEETKETFRAHMCQRTGWKAGSSVICGVCRGEAHDFMFSDRDAFENAQVLKEKQMRRKVS